MSKLIKLLLLILLASTNQVFAQEKYSVGDKGPAGGWVFYTESNGVHGMEAAPRDQGDTDWFNGTYITTGATGKLIGTGKTNTDAIIKSQKNGSYAAQLCNNLAEGGFTDWFLPSKDELDLVYKKIRAFGGFVDNSYWSSTEDSEQKAWNQYFYNGDQYNIGKNSMCAVRCIRSF